MAPITSAGSMILIPNLPFCDVVADELQNQVDPWSCGRPIRNAVPFHGNRSQSSSIEERGATPKKRGGTGCRLAGLLIATTKTMSGPPKRVAVPPLDRTSLIYEENLRGSDSSQLWQ
jgi:hypothetical protein